MPTVPQVSSDDDTIGRLRGGSTSARESLGQLGDCPEGFSLAAQVPATQCRLIENQRPEPVTMTVYLPTPASDDELVIPRGTTLKQAERLLITAALRWSDGRRATTAQLLGVSRRTLYNKLSKKDSPPISVTTESACAESQMSPRLPVLRPAIRRAFPTSIESAFA